MNLREAIKKQHDAAEAHPLTALIMSGKMTPVIYHDMLCNLACVYHAIETRARLFGLLTGLSGIERIDAINQDIAELRQQYNLQPPDSYESVWKHVAHVASLDRDGVLAHMYVQHMGDMYGGQMLKSKLPGSGKRFEFTDRGQLVSNLRQLLTDDLGAEACIAFEFTLDLFDDIANKHDLWSVGQNSEQPA